VSTEVDLVPELRVEAGSGSYPVLIELGAVDRVGEWLRQHAGGSKVMVVCDANTAAVAGERVAEAARAEIHTVPPGEQSKDVPHLEELSRAAARAGLDRGSIIVAVGGGVVGDLAGTLAATYLRGVRLVQVPTTLLAMVDSSIGGKVAVNLDEGKNLVGAFKPPQAVFIDPGLLIDLPVREFVSGMAEVIKSGLIADAELCTMLHNARVELQQRRPDVVTDVITRTCAVKVGVVSRDETETGERAILNYGHTFAHALEAASGYSPALTHGEAVSVGMGVAARLGQASGVTPSDVVELQAHLLAAYGLPSRSPVEVATDELIGAMAHDKKARAGEVGWVFLEAVGRASWGHAVAIEHVRDAVETAL
jgi:3-dehydroquinate synthase